eukprot:1808344-Prymnesium_polylepis.1
MRGARLTRAVCAAHGTRKCRLTWSSAAAQSSAVRRSTGCMRYQSSPRPSAFLPSSTTRTCFSGGTCARPRGRTQRAARVSVGGEVERRRRELRARTEGRETERASA